MSNYKVLSKTRLVTEEDLMGLPRGFRFHPTDEEIVVHYLIPKALNSNFSAAAIGQADFNKCEPWDLPKKANMGEMERYYYCQRDRKYPLGLRTNRATKAGYWKATGKDKEIYKGNGDGREMVGMKKTLVFYTGRAPNGNKSNYIMHEYRLQSSQFSSIPKDDGWVVSRVFHKIASNGNHKGTSSDISSFFHKQGSDYSSSTDEFEALPRLVDHSAAPPTPHMSQDQDLKSKAVMPESYGFPQQPINMQSNIWHPSSSVDAYDDDQLMYSDDPAYYYPSNSETLLLQTLDCVAYDESIKDDKMCKVEHGASSAAISFSGQDDMSNNNHYFEISSDDQEYNGLFSHLL
ncbi:unnamed protein product [Rhodiola kirilowii]